MITTRFAPSPTGRLHLGHAFAAKVAHDFARENGGEFLLRFEDIDHTRVRPEFYDGILEDLHWLGLDWDGEAWRQLDRLEHYQTALEQLIDLGVVYPCYCTRKEIELELSNLSNAPHGPEGPLYPGTCRDAKVVHPQREPTWRLDVQKVVSKVGSLTFEDARHGEVEVDANILGDLILARKDIGTSYHLAVTVDDAAQKISHVTRGEDLLPSTHVHRLLQTLLDLPEPLYRHHSLVLDESGKRLSKRHDSLSLAILREQGEDIWKLLEPIEATLKESRSRRF